MDRIENHVANTREYVESAEGQLAQAQQSQSSARRVSEIFSLSFLTYLFSVVLHYYFILFP